MNYCLIAGMIVVVTFAIAYGESARKTKSNQEFLALQNGLLKGCLVSLGLLVLPIFGSLAFPSPQPNLSAVIFVLELVGVMFYSHVELRRLNYRMVKLSCLLALLAGIALIWCQLFSYYQMDRDFFGNLKFIMATLPTWLLAIIQVVLTFLDGPKLRAKKKSKAEVENAKLREQIEHMQNQQNQLQQDNEKLQNALRKVTPELKSESVTEDKKAESNLPKNTQTEEESTTQVEEAQTTTSAPKSDAEDKPKVEVTNPSMTEVQQQKLSEILNRLASDPSPESQQAAIEEIVKNYRAATAKEAPAPEEETSSQESEFADFEEESDEEEEEGLDPVDDEDWEDDTILTDLFRKINPVTIVLAAAIIFVIYAIARVVF